MEQNVCSTHLSAVVKNSPHLGCWQYSGSKLAQCVSTRFRIVVETVLRSDEVNGFKLLSHLFHSYCHDKFDQSELAEWTPSKHRLLNTVSPAHYCIKSSNERQLKMRIINWYGELKNAIDTKKANGQLNWGYVEFESWKRQAKSTQLRCMLTGFHPNTRSLGSNYKY